MAVFIIFSKLETRFYTHYQNASKQKKGVSNPKSKQLCVYHVQNHPESRLETLIIRQKCDDKRTPIVPVISQHRQSTNVEIITWLEKDTGRDKS